jgi:methionine synthase I (cobalamin-dependent)
MSRLAPWLANGPLISDGAWGTEFQKRGLPPGQHPDPWNLERPEIVLQVAQAYVEAGSEIILTNTFRANAVAMPEMGRDRLAAMNRAGVELSRRAAGSHARVAASIGPSGRVLMMGEITPEQAFEAFENQANALAEAGPDALLIETMSDPDEADIALRAALQTGLPVILSFAFDSGKNKDRTMMGTSPEKIRDRFATSGADALGANCGAGVEFFPAVCRRLKHERVPVWIKANAGLPSNTAIGVSYATSPVEFAAHLSALLEAGASVVGGCCGTTPDFIRALVQERDRLRV